MNDQIYKNPIERVGRLLGISRAARLCGVSDKAVRKWMEAGRLPRTEATGETDYARRLAKAQRMISYAELIAPTMQNKSRKLTDEQNRLRKRTAAKNNGVDESGNTRVVRRPGEAHRADPGAVDAADTG